MTLAMLLTLKDLASGPLGRFQSNLQKTSQNMMAVGSAAMETGRNILDEMAKPLSKFTEAEDASIRLESTMMRANGRVAKSFEKVNDQATLLGNKLPGNTADFQEMYSVL